jgi:hypothetical protein
MSRVRSVNQELFLRKLGTRDTRLSHALRILVNTESAFLRALAILAWIASVVLVGGGSGGRAGGGG